MAVLVSFYGSFAFIAESVGVLGSFWEFMRVTLGVLRAEPHLFHNKPDNAFHAQGPSRHSNPRSAWRIPSLPYAVALPPWAGEDDGAGCSLPVRRTCRNDSYG